MVVEMTGMLDDIPKSADTPTKPFIIWRQSLRTHYDAGEIAEVGSVPLAADSGVLTFGGIALPDIDRVADAILFVADRQAKRNKPGDGPLVCFLSNIQPGLER